MLPIKLITTFLLYKLSNDFDCLKKFEIKKIKINVKPCQTRKCTIYNCKSVQISDGYVNLQCLKETKTNCRNGRQIWKNIYLLCNSELEMKQKKHLYLLVSGLHFSINTHISYNYYDFYLFHLSSVNNYAKYRKYYVNYIYLFIYVRNRLQSVLNKRSNIHKTQDILVSTNTLTKMIEEIGCLDCDTCKILGTLQFQGVLSCTIMKNRNDFLYTVILYKKLLRTIKYVLYLENNLTKKKNFIRNENTL